MARSWLNSFQGLLPASLATGCLLTPLLPLSAGDAITRDLQQTIAVRKALESDAQLAPLQIGVRVQKRVAVLWGTVSSLEMVKRAETLVRNIPDVQEVRNELTIDVSLAPKVAPGPKQKPPEVVWQVPPENKLRPELLTKFETKKVPDPSAWRQETLKPAAQPDPGGPVLAPIAIPMPSPQSNSGQPAAVDRPLEQRLAALQREDARCRWLRLETKGGQVFISGIVSRWEDLTDISQRIANMSGVQRVVLQSVRADGQP